MKLKTVSLGLIATATAFVLGACGNNTGGGNDNAEADNKTSVALITDTGGVNDRSFNQSAWEGLEAWGDSKGLTRGTGGFNYFQSATEADYQTNTNQAVAQGFNLIFGIGFGLRNTITETAAQNPDKNFVIIDDVGEGHNVASVTFADNENAFLAGIAAAMQTNTDRVGFIGGVRGEVIDRFEAGFTAGVHHVNPDIHVDVQYAGSFNDPAQGQAIARAMIASGADVIYQAAGGTGTGVFQEVNSQNSLKDADSKEKIWVIGVDRDQHDEGNYTSRDGKESNFVLVSTIKEVGSAVKSIANLTEEGNFPGGQHIVYGLKDGGVDIAKANASQEIQEAITKAREQIISGDITVPTTPSN